MARKISRWMVENLLWDTRGVPAGRSWRSIWALRKLLVAVAVAAVLTWEEWLKHHPPEIVLIAFIHLIFVLAAIAVLVAIFRWLRRSPSPS